MPPSKNPGMRSADGRQTTPGRAEYAAEFLRRNRRFQTEYAHMSKMARSGTVRETAAHAAFARRWGLSFRLCAI